MAQVPRDRPAREKIAGGRSGMMYGRWRDGMEPKYPVMGLWGRGHKKRPPSGNIKKQERGGEGSMTKHRCDEG